MRNKLFVLFFSFIFLAAAVTGCGSNQAPEENNDPAQESKDTFSYAMSGLYKPFNYKDGGVLTGFDVEIGEEIAKRMGMEADPVTNPWETIIQGLKAGKYDAIIGSMAYTEERSEQVDFSRPYYRSGAQIFVSPDNDAIKGPEDLTGKVIGVVKSSTFRDVALKYTENDKVIGYDSDVIALQDLPTGRVDAVITDQMVGLVAMKNGLKIVDVGSPSGWMRWRYQSKRQ
ncbi:hypothetical protein N752_19085 [Desulforamulus aquiferis]|nr:transporter substrate-binding domain-containing protein [Desulforamulus aquiferis]RYD03515.1 hypothetical protein N752_19085 [Desulforamulus aquiferis]